MVPPVPVELDLRLFSFAILLLSQCGDAGPSTVVGFGISYALLFQELRPWIGGFTLLLSVAYGLLGYAIMARGREVVYLSFSALGMAVEGAVLIWLSFTLRMYQLRWFGVAVSAAFAVWLLSVDTPEGLDRSLRPILNVYLP